MKIGIFSASDGGGGAFIASYRLHQGLIRIGVNSTMLVDNKKTEEPTVVTRPNGWERAWSKAAKFIDRLPLKAYPKQKPGLFSLHWFPDRTLQQANRLNFDIVNLQWVNLDYLTIENIARLKKPLVWTILDMWPFTGGCHYDLNCDRYITSCGNCPQLNSGKERDLSRWVWERKHRAWQNLDLTIVAPSSWIAEYAAASSIGRNFPIKVIPLGLDTKVFRPKEQQTAREQLNLPKNKQLILFGALAATKDPRKGFQFIISALQKLKAMEWQEQIELVVFGASNSSTTAFDFKVHYLGHLREDAALATAYAAADVMIVPSLQESFGQTASESLACGTPVVAFNATGLRDIVDHQQNGYLAQPYEVEDLAKGIAWVLEDKDRHKKLQVQARQKAEREFSFELQAKRYLSLYEEILDRQKQKLHTHI